MGIQDNEQIGLFDDTQAAEQEIAIVVEREYDRTKQPEECSYIKNIKNRHEGYGHAAECVAMLRYLTKQIDGDLKEFLSRLPQFDDGIVKDVSGDIYSHATQLAIQAVKTAAVAKRIIYDVLVYDEELPIEAAINDSAADTTEQESENIDYNEAEAN